MRKVTGGLILAVGIAVACGTQQQQRTWGVAPSPAVTNGIASGIVVPLAVDFPPRNEPFDFRNQLEEKYRDQLRRGATQTYVDVEGDIVWTTEYLRYRVNQCDHPTAVQKVMAQIDGLGVQSICGNPPSGQIAFPPRNEPFAFRQQLDDKYRTGLRRGAVNTFVDIEGDIVWTSEYLRYRLNNCDHATAVTKTFQQIDGQGIQAVCASAPSPGPSPTPTPSPSPTPVAAPGLPSRTPVGTTFKCSLDDIVHPASCVNEMFGNATALCTDGARSCSTSNSGTCSSHQGVYCFVCPGGLCPN